METIFAFATAPVKSGVAVLRVSGPAAPGVVTALTGKAALPPRQATLLVLRHPKTLEVIDEALVLWFPSPASFTGEDVAEFHVHGSRAVMQELLELLAQMPGLRLAEPGEFSLRAFHRGKMDLTEAEGLADLIDAETRAQARQAMRQKQGNLRILYDQWRSRIITILAHLEAYIDFPDEEIPESVIASVTQQVSDLSTSLSHHLSDNRRGEKLRHGVRVVIIGAPNAGKSSLINALTGRDVAIVSEEAGTTRDVIDVHLDVGGFPVLLSDTAGLRDAGGAIEQEGIRRALERAEDADILLALFDASTFPFLDAATVAALSPEALVVVNKSDVQAPLPSPLVSYTPLAISVKTGQGLDRLLSTLESRVREMVGQAEDPVITRQRHRQLLARALDSLQAFDITAELELATEHLRLAAFSLGQVTGHIGVEDILDEVFSTFCIGK